MVVCTGLAVATVVTGGTAAAAGAAIGSTAGLGGAAAGGSAAVATAAGAATSAGAIAGATATGSAVGAGVGAVAGGTAAAGVGGSGLGLGALVAGSGPVGWLAVGTSVDEKGNGVTYDCWKPVIHDVTEEPSNGMLLKDLVGHPNIAKATVTSGVSSDLPHIVLENVWNESFEIQYLQFQDSGKLVCHAQPIDDHSDTNLNG